MTDTTPAPSPEDPDDAPAAGADGRSSRRRELLGQAFVAGLTSEQLAGLAAQSKRALADVTTLARAVAPMAAETHRTLAAGAVAYRPAAAAGVAQAVSNLIAASHHRPPLVVWSDLEAQTAGLMARSLPAFTEATKTASLLAASQIAQNTAEKVTAGMEFTRHAGWTSPVVQELVNGGVHAQAMLRSFPLAHEHLLAAQRVAASALAAEGLATTARAVLTGVPLPSVQVPNAIFAAMPALAGIQEHLATLLRTWAFDRDFGTPFVQSRARRALASARAARRALHQGDRDPLRRFLRSWLGMKPEPAVEDAAEEVLLEPGWDSPFATDESMTGEQALTTLRERVRAGARRDLPVWEHRPGRQRVVLLEHLGLVADGRPPEHDLSWGVEDPRLRIVLSLMTPRDRAVAEALAAGADTWADAAVEAGFSPEVGEAVRRRRRRLIAEANRRLMPRE